MTSNIEQEASLTGKICGKIALRGRLQPEVILSAKASICTSAVIASNIEKEASLTGKICGKIALRGRLQPEVILSAKASICTSAIVETEEITVTPNNMIQEVFPSDGKFFDKVTVEAIPKNYGLITYNGFEITVS